jgi:hypothetical protein
VHGINVFSKFEGNVRGLDVDEFKTWKFCRKEICTGKGSNYVSKKGKKNEKKNVSRPVIRVQKRTCGRDRVVSVLFVKMTAYVQSAKLLSFVAALSCCFCLLS